MPKGPLGGPRPFSQYRIIVDPHEPAVYLIRVGPLGGPRPLAKNNPPVTQERIDECVLSDAGQSFGAGFVSGGATTDVQDLPPQARVDALEMAEKWCRGILEATAMEEQDFEFIQAERQQVEEELEAAQ